jgi:lysylphosphatidylglycerol synthetase-like protein (DUF2156 family)
MEFEELKNLWQQDIVPPSGSEKRLSELLSRKSNSPVSKMKRNLKVELWSVVILYGLSIVFYFTAWNGKMMLIGWFMLVLALLFIWYYFKKIRVLHRMSAPAGQVKQTLQTQIRSLESFVKLYFIAGTILIPVSMLFFGWIYYTQSRYIAPTNILFPSDENPLWKVILAWVIIISALTFISSFLNRWYINKLYSRHIEKLKNILKEMEED